MSLNEKSKKQFPDRKRDKNKIGNYIIGTTIEENLFIKIRKAKNLTTNENVIIKIIDKSYLYENENNLNNLTSEINILKIMHHKNVIRLYEMREMATNLYLIMEYCENNSLFEYVKNYNTKEIWNENHNGQNDKRETDNYNSLNNIINERSRNHKTEAILDKENSNFKSESSDLININSKRNFSDFSKTMNDYATSNSYSNNKTTNLNPTGNSAKNLVSISNFNVQPHSPKANGLPEIEACRLFQDLIDGLEYLHSQNICIRDINPHNVFLDYKNNLKIANFSFSKIYQNDKLLTTPIGMLQFTAPEVLLGKGYHGLFSDIWSSGVTLYFMITGTLPFLDQLDEVSLKKIYENKIDFPMYVSAQAKDLIINILNKNCLERFDLNQIKSHPWFNLSRPNLNKGINVNFISIPVDEKIIFKLENLEFDGETLRNKIRDNIHDESTAAYYLFLKNQIKGGYKSIADLESQLFVDYINNPRNFIKNIEFIKKEKELLNEESEYLRNNYDYCGNANEKNFGKSPNQTKEEEKNGHKKRSSLLIEEGFEMANADMVETLNFELADYNNEEELKSNNKKLGFKPSKSLLNERQSNLPKNPLMRSLTSRLDKSRKFKNIPSYEFILELENELDLNGLDPEFNEGNQSKDKDDIDYQKGLLYNIEEIGNDFDQPDDDLINLMNSTNKTKNDKKEKSPEKMRKSSIFTKYSAEPIKEENVIDYVKPKKNSYLKFLERNDVYGKLSYNKKERESLFKDIEFDNHYHLTDTKDPKSVIERFKSIGKSVNSPGKTLVDKENKGEFISKTNKNMLFNFFKMKIQEIINEDEDHDNKLEERKENEKKILNPKTKQKKGRDIDNKHKPKNLKLEIKNKEKELQNNKLQLLKSSNIRERIREYSKETMKKRSILSKLDNGEVETILENLYNYSSDDLNSNSSGSEGKSKKEFKVFKPRKIMKEQDPKEKQKELKNKAKEFSKKVKINEEQKIKMKLDRRDSAISAFEIGFGSDKYDTTKINKYFRSDKNKDSIKLLEKNFNMENGPINIERVEKILKDLHDQKHITNYAEFYKEIKDLNKKIKVMDDEKICSDKEVVLITESQEEQEKINKNLIKVKQIRTSSLPKNLNTYNNYDYLLKDLTHRDPITPKHKTLVLNDQDCSINKNGIKMKKKVSDNGDYYQKTSFSVDKTDAHEEEDDTGVFIDENFFGKLKDNIKKTLKETDQILMESRKIKKDIIKTNKINSNIKNKPMSNSFANTELNKINSNKKINVKKHNFSSLEKLDLCKTFKYMNLITDNNETEKNIKGQRRLSINLIEDKLLNISSNITNTKVVESNKEEIKFRKLLEEDNISPVNNSRNVNSFNNVNWEQNRNNLCNKEEYIQTNHLTNQNLNSSENNEPIIKIIKVKNLKNENEQHEYVNKDVKDKTNEALNKGNKVSLSDLEQKNRLNNLNNIKEPISLPTKITEKINEDEELKINNLPIKRDSNSTNVGNNSYTNSNFFKTEPNEILNYKNLLENLGVYRNKEKINKKAQPIVNNTNISITIKKKNYYFDNKAGPKGKSFLKKIEVVKEDSADQNRINNQGKLSESTLDSFNYQEIFNLKPNNEPLCRNNLNLYTDSISNKKSDSNREINREKNIQLTEVSNTEICKTTNEVFKVDSINLTESMDSGFSYIKDLKSKDFIENKDIKKIQKKLPNNNENYKKDYRRMILQKNTTANLICQNKTEDKNIINLTSKPQELVKKPSVSIKNSKNELVLNNLSGKDNSKIIKVYKQNIHATIMNYLAESKTCFLFKNEKFKISKSSFNYDIELTKIISNQNEFKPLNSSTSCYYVKFVFAKGNKNSFIEEISKIQNLLME